MKQTTLTEAPGKELMWIQAPRMLFRYCLVLHLSPLTPECRQLSSKASQTLLPRLNTAPPVTEVQCQIHPAGTYSLCPLYKSGKGTAQYNSPCPARHRSEALLKSEETGCTNKLSPFFCKERYMLIYTLLNFYMKCTLYHLCLTSVKLRKRRENL